MTREEFEYAIKSCGCFIYRGHIYYEETELIKAFEDMGLIEQEPSGDALSREELLKAIAYKIWTSTEQIGDDYKYIKSISKPTGVDFDSLSDSQTIHHLTDKAYSELCLLAEKGREVLQAQADGDAINRQAVIDITWEEPSYTDALNVLTEVRDKVKALPSVKPQEKMGKWISDSESYGYGKDDYHCSICGRTVHLCRPLEQLTNYPYCHCGAKMVKE